MSVEDVSSAHGTGRLTIRSELRVVFSKLNV